MVFVVKWKWILQQVLYCCWFLYLGVVFSCWSRSCTKLEQKAVFFFSSILSQPSCHTFTFPFELKAGHAHSHWICHEGEDSLFFSNNDSSYEVLPKRVLWKVVWASGHKASLQLISNNQQWMRICWGAAFIWNLTVTSYIEIHGMSLFNREGTKKSFSIWNLATCTFMCPPPDKVI